MKRSAFLYLWIIIGVSACSTTAVKESVTEDNVRIIHLTQPPNSRQQRYANHRVEEGETLFSIARKYRLDYRQLAKWNNIRGNYVIFPGQELVLHSSASKPKRTKGVQTKSSTQPSIGIAVELQATSETKSVQPSISTTFKFKTTPKTKSVWPTRGQRRYENSQDGKGLLIKTQPAGHILAAQKGSVVYVGDELKEYGMMILISHAEGVLTVYAKSVQPLVKEGQVVKAGAKIATAGGDEEGTRTFYFEARKEGKVVNPLTFLRGS